MIEYIFYACVAATFLVALGNWRAALYMCVVLDVARDPVRKLTTGHPVLITQSVNVIWLAIALGVFAHERRRLVDMARAYPQLKTSAAMLFVALVPGAVTAVLNFDSGWKLALIGAASYLALIPGILIGISFPRSTRDVVRFMTFYCFVNGAFLVSGLAEYLHWSWPALGGIDMNWLRSRAGFAVELISGFYRSPDILGLHAAGVCLFAMVLSLTGKPPGCYRWYLGAFWGAILLLLAGRRKMIGIPLVFAASFAYLTFRRTRQVAGSVRYAIIGAGAMLIVIVFATMLGISGKYSTYASSLWSAEGAERSGSGVIGSAWETVQQSGFFGKGLGTATQGAYHLVDGRLGWQEDGAGKLFVELGLPGVALFACAAWMLLRACGAALRTIPAGSAAFRLQAGLMSVVAGNAASFVVSHQAYSGDPTSVCLVLLCLGCVLALPEVVLERRSICPELTLPLAPNRRVFKGAL